MHDFVSSFLSLTFIARPKRPFCDFLFVTFLYSMFFFILDDSKSESESESDGLGLQEVRKSLTKHDKDLDVNNVFVKIE